MSTEASQSVRDRGSPVAFFCSQSCPGDVILKAQDWANAREPESPPIIGGFHTLVERDVLRILLRGQAPVVIVLARSIEGRRAPKPLGVAIREAATAGRARIMSPFPATERRTTADAALERNRYILSLCRSVVFAHASPRGKTEQLAREAAELGISLSTFPSKFNSNLSDLGAVDLAGPPRRMDGLGTAEILPA